MSVVDHPSERVSAPQSRSRGKQVWLLVLLGFLAIGGVLLFTEHRAHVLGVLIYLPLLACPLMHFFMHGSHGGHRPQSHATRTAAHDR